MIENCHNNTYYSPVTALAVAHHGISEHEQALGEAFCPSDLDLNSLGQAHFNWKKSCKAKQSYIFISAFAWVFLQPICATAICATLNNGQKRSIKLRNFTPSPDLNGCQFYWWISVIIFVWDNKVKVFLSEIYCNQFQRFDCNRGQSEFHRFFTRHSQNPYSSLQRSQISSVKNNKYTNTYMSLRMVKWHLSDIYLY